MNNKLPPELHMVKGTKGVNMGALLPDNVKSRVPVAEWMDNPDAWNKVTFVEETAEYLELVYGIGSRQDRHILAMLADYIDMYIDCSKNIAIEGLISITNDGKTVGQSPYVAIRKDSLMRIINLMNELGLTPRSRLQSGKNDAAPMSKFLAGVVVK